METISFDLKTNQTILEANINKRVGNFTETDPTVPKWAKQPEKPKYTAEEVGAVSKEYFDKVIIKEYYYNTLEDAILDMNSDEYNRNTEDQSTAKIKLLKDSLITISLLDNITTHTNNLQITKESIINLNGFDINLNGTFWVLANTTINSKNSKIKKDNNNTIPFRISAFAKLIINDGSYEFTGNSDNDNLNLFLNGGTLELNNVNCKIVNNGKSMTLGIYLGDTIINNSTIYAQSEFGTVYCIYVPKDKKSIINNSNMHSDSMQDETGSSSIGIANYGELQIFNSKIFADACGANASSENIIEESATGIINYGLCYCYNTDVTGTLSGFINCENGKVYVEGGTFIGQSHGGFYLAHGVNGEAFIRDAITLCGHYTGIHGDYINPGGILAQMYVGGGSGEENSNITAYLDGCIFGEGSDNVYNIVLRGSSGEEGHNIHISNSNFTKPRGIRIDKKSMTLNLGAGNIYPEDGFGIDSNGNAQDKVIYTDKIYRKYGNEENIDGKELNKIIDELNNIPAWAKQEEKPYYSAEEILCNVEINGEQKTNVADVLEVLYECYEECKAFIKQMKEK